MYILINQLSASSSSSSTNPKFAWPPRPPGPSPFDPSSHPPSDPFNNTSSFAEDPRGPTMTMPHRAVSQPTAFNDIAIDPEFSGVGPPAEEYTFDPPVHPVPPAYNRTYSAPLPARVGYLRHPLSPLHDPYGSVQTSPASDDDVRTPLHTLSLELADSVQSAIQTLLHLSPPHLLDNAKEQYSGCTVQMPTTSLSALLTSMRSLNYLSANVETLCAPLHAQESGWTPPAVKPANDFDIGELLQSVADLLSGQAAQAGVDFVLFHGDVGIKHVSVCGDGEGLAYVLSHVIRQILLVAHKGDTIELGLQIIPQSPSLTPRLELPLSNADVDKHRQANMLSGGLPTSPGKTFPSTPFGLAQGPLLCIFEIVHNIFQSYDSPSQTPRAELNPFSQLKEQGDAATPRLDTIMCRRLLQSQNATLRTDAKPSSPLNDGLPRRAYELSVMLPRGRPIPEPAALSAEEEAVRQPFSTVRLAREPTLFELSDFAESLRGKKVLLHASLTSVFARHLTSYLAVWGLDISHKPLEESEPHSRDGSRRDSGYAGSPNTPPAMETVTMPTPMSLAGSGVFAAREADKFIIIDDDVSVLRRELIRLRSQALPTTVRPHLGKRPTMTSRARSTPHVRQVSNLKRPGQMIIHFTSLANYNLVRDVIVGLIGSPWATQSGTLIHPDVMVIPKPVGPRRFLTALHTAVHQPIVDPYFSPIATSPRSPGGGFFANLRTPTGTELARDNGFFDRVMEESLEHPTHHSVRSPLGEYPPIQSNRRLNDALHLSIPPSSDLVSTPAFEYFSSVKTGSAASGIVLQSPDGTPVGMFFEPPAKADGRRSSYGRMPSDTLRRKATGRRTSSGANQDESNQSPATSPQNARRISNMSSSTSKTDVKESASRRSSGSKEMSPTMTPDLPGRGVSRRKTFQINQNVEPIIAQGRDRAATLTQVARKNPASPPILPSPKEVHPSQPTKTSSPGFVKPPKVLRTVRRSVSDDVVVPPINVLIVEDNPINQNILAMFLRKKKIQYQSAKDGLEAVEKWRTGSFHLILMDIQLPVMDGIEATKEIRKLERSHNIGVFPSTPGSEYPRSTGEAPSSPFRSSVIIVALTASSLQSDRVVALAAGCNDFLTKPVSLKWLERKIVEWGCMQALIDFEGWRRWKGSDPKDPNETKRGFTIGPQAAAKTLAGRLRIERKHARSPGPATPTTNDSSGPQINIEAPTPHSELVDSNDEDKPIILPTPAKSLQSARSDLADKRHPIFIPSPHYSSPPAAGLPKSSSLMSIHEEDYEQARALSLGPNIKAASLPDLQTDVNLSSTEAAHAAVERELPELPSDSSGDSFDTANESLDSISLEHSSQSDLPS
ncbi:hypothetical protein TREMEDRAFT_44022 [Tremella mesenterica DSM 1558]|uniref:uncharacterized protein n=1 Tax=Tremella mesenterica (strain ATCC 24925 / CBS 8224 / DSM 1558 / NBRC 9311 / NRRL Y-6157 / RJB 2259-6 / UBC 559-6) TaxID=578456 RepID=UPI0003F4A655|nr:uncharacterized protein TREMEDRAFT_44022 [Tremella mesenterica DSM 1558]EIW69473.1 hypothetical protein TREMEDRAFT_44022 [Tremella mesenterica DSM 1558]